MKRSRRRTVEAPLTAKTGVIYARVSSKEQQEEGYSIEAQLKLTREYAAKNNITIIKEFVEAETAKKAGRTEFSNMVQFLKENPSVKHVVGEKTDRLYRNFVDSITLNDDALGLNIHLIKEGSVVNSSASTETKFMHGMYVLLANRYINNLSEEVKKGMKQKASEGLYPTKAPIGYLNQLNERGERIIAPDPHRARYVRKAFEMASQNLYSVDMIADALYAEGFRSKTGKRVGKATVYNILQSTIYYGEYFWSDKYYHGTHEPLISKELFDKVQDVFDLRQNPKKAKHIFTYRGVFTCHHCGCAITAEKKKKRYVYYRCTNGKKTCSNVTYIAEEDIESAVVEALKAIRPNETIIELTRKSLMESFASEKEYHLNAVTNLRTRLARIKALKEKAYEDRLQGFMDAGFIEEQFNKWIEEESSIRYQIIKHENANNDYLITGIKIMELAEKAHSLFPHMDVTEKKEMAKLVLSNPVIKEGSVCFSYQKPFNLIVESPSCSVWLGD